MLFNSLEFLIFFPVVTLLYFLLSTKWRWLHLLVSSCIFYCAFIPAYILILFFTIIVDYIAGIMIENAIGQKKKSYLIISIITNIGILCVFKYYNFFIDNINDLLGYIGINYNALPYLNIILPIGLSFHTFQAMSYTIEVYRGKQKAEKHFGIYALYVMFYPQLVAGPIERPQNLLHQFHENKDFNYLNVTAGLKLMMWGMFKKVVIADRLALLTEPVFNDPTNFTPLVLLMAVVFFSFQIFCDFSGYSDIAVGSARVMGFHLMKNFDRPYHSRNISEFWKRWHISLSTWFKDYLYISLGGNRVSIPRWYFNLFFVFMISGFWHGANWTFIVWGALHGFYLIFAIISEKFRNNLIAKSGINKFRHLHIFLQVFTTYMLVTFAWIFFRATSLQDAFFIMNKIPLAIKQGLNYVMIGDISSNGLKQTLGHIPIYSTDLILSILLIIFLEMVHYLQAKYNLEEYIKEKPIVFRWLLYYTLLISIIFLGVYQNRQFIYFQF